jgi:hypothetical protein
MKAIVTVFRNEFAGKELVKLAIEKYTDQIELVSEVYVINPKSGKLFDLLNELRANKIAYGTHFNTGDHHQI